MIARAGGAPYRTQQLNDELHRLHARASSPSIKTMAEHCRLGSGTVFRLFSEPTLPKPRPLLAVVEYLAKQCYKLDPDDECDRFDALYLRALDEWIPSPFPSDRELGPDDEDPGPCPGLGAGPKPPRPCGPGGGALPPAPGTPQIGPATHGRPPTGAGPARRHTYRALLIAVACRSDHCSGCSGMGTGLEQFRRTLAGFFPDGIHVLLDGTRAEIWRALNAASVHADGTLLVYFSGHALPDNRTSDVALLTADTVVTDGGLVENTIAMRDVRHLLAGATSASVVLLLDTCLPGGPPAGVILPAPIPPDDLLSHGTLLNGRTPRPTVIVGHDAGSGRRLREAVIAQLGGGGTLDVAIRRAAAELEAVFRAAHGGAELSLPVVSSGDAKGHRKAIGLAAVGEKIARALDDDTIELWNPLTGLLDEVLPGSLPATPPVRVPADGIGTVTAVAVSPDGTQIAAATADGSVHVLSRGAGRRHAVFRLDFTVRACTWAPDGHSLAVVGEHTGIYLLDL